MSNTALAERPTTIDYDPRLDGLDITNLTPDAVLELLPSWLLTYPIHFIECRLAHDWVKDDERIITAGVWAEFYDCDRCEMERCRATNMVTGSTDMDYDNKPDGYSIGEIEAADFAPTKAELRLALRWRTRHTARKANADQREQWERLFDRAVDNFRDTVLGP